MDLVISDLNESRIVKGIGLIIGQLQTNCRRCLIRQALLLYLMCFMIIHRLSLLETIP